ncbi:MAG: patatin-like phospholipase family protein [Pseudomonadota bacterium]
MNKLIPLLAVGLLAACASPRTGELAQCNVEYESPPATLTSDQDAIADSLQESAFLAMASGVDIQLRANPVKDSRISLESRISNRLKQKLLNSEEYRVLALSTGGAWGAFGSGFLHGLTENEFADNADITEKKYDLVTGASTGAIIAPFAFLGEKSDYKAIAELYLNLTDDQVFTRRPLLSLLTADSVFNTTRMKDFFLGKMDEFDILERVAIEARDNRVLAVSAVNLDTGQLEIFDLTEIAIMEGPTDEERAEMFVDRLLASASVTGAFNPVFIDGCMYTDSGARRNVFITSEFVACYANFSNYRVSMDDHRLGGQKYAIATQLPASANPSTPDGQFCVGGPPAEAGGARPSIRVDMVVNSSRTLGRQVTEHGLRPILFRALPTIMDSTMSASISRIADTGTIFGWRVRYRDAFDLGLATGGSVFSLDGQVFSPDFLEKVNAAGYKAGTDSSPWRDIPAPSDPTFIDPTS